jgi:predicted GIY-YIG superfamily endonuclease
MGANCTLYWIKLPEHTDIFSQGYVGITKQLLSKRFKEHKCGKSSIVSNAIAKYPECQIVPILVGSREYCLNIEFKLRPTDQLR